MLTDLHIKDVVIIDNLLVAFDRGFVTFTGETGAGKSIILDALGLSLGQRSEARLVRNGCEQATVTATFDITQKAVIERIRALCDEHAYDYDMPLMLRRVLSKDGRSKAFVNDQPVSIAFLKALGGLLVEIHGQFDTHDLLDARSHRALLDQYAGLEKPAAQIVSLWNTWQNTRRELQELEQAIASFARDREYWQAIVEELRELAPREKEEKELAAERSIMMHAEKIIENLNEADQALSISSNGARARMNTALKNLERIQDKIPGRLDNVLDTLNRALIEMDEAVSEIETLGYSLQFDRNAQAEVDERLFALRGAARKHNIAVIDLPKFLLDTEEKLNQDNDRSAARDVLLRQVAEARDAYIKAAETLSAARVKAATRMAADVMAEFPPLKMDKARFAVQVDAKAEENWGPDGIDSVQFQISTNPGVPLGPLNKIASGGEMARFMLAIKVVTQRVDATPCLIFDEIDTGVGGAVAEAIGMRLRRLGDTSQVFAVTHSPQVAAKGHQHWRITKTADTKSTRTQVVLLSDVERVEEIGRMLSGSVITAEARAAAGHLLNDAIPVTAKAPKTTKRKTA